jgi:hypothetical protein
VVTAFKEDWHSRNKQVAELLVSFLEKGLGYSRNIRVRPATDENAAKAKLYKEYEAYLRTLERKCQAQIRSLYKHNIFNVDLPAHSILQEDLFAEKTWEFLGLNSSQLIIAGALTGAAVGAGVDIAAAGLSFGIFSALGGFVGAAGTALKGREFLSDRRLLGMSLHNEQLRVGPVKNIQLLFVLLDRQLLFYRHVTNWSHGRRDYENVFRGGEKKAFTAKWEKGNLDICFRFFKQIRGNKMAEGQDSREAFVVLLEKALRQISCSDI